MALGRKQGGGGLDISGVGKQRVRLSGGDARGGSGLRVPNSNDRKPHGGRRGRQASSRRKGSYVGGVDRKRGSRVPRKTLGIIAAVMIGAILLAVGVGYLVYQQTVRNALKPELDTQSLSAVLSQPSSDDEASWSVLVKTNAASAESGRGEVEDLALVYADSNNKTLSFLWIPINSRVYLDGYGYRTVAESFSLLQESGLVSSVSKLGDVSISHYMEINDAGLSRFEEDLAPLDIDEATADRESLVSAICKRICGSSSEQISEMAGFFTSCFATDMDSASASSTFSSLQGLDVSSDLYQADAPVESDSSTGSQYVSLNADTWNSMVARVRTGQSPVASKKELSQYEAMRGSSTVDIWNGVGVSGIASDCSTELKKLGWKIGKTGNAAQFVYKETLVVYNDTKNRKLAELVVSDLGQGRVVRGAARYSFTGDVLVVLGSDYRPY